MFYIGQRVVFIGNGGFARHLAHYPDLKVPKKNHVYTVRELTFHETAGLRVEEILNNKHHYKEGYEECAWLVDEFRPLEERKTDISIFEKLLNPQTETSL